MAKKIRGFLSYFAVPNLTLLLILFFGVTSLLLPLFNPGIGRVSWASIAEGRYLDIALQPFRLEGGPIYIAFGLYITFSFGSWLESEMDSITYTFYIYTGYAFILIGGLLFPLFISGWFLLLSILFALAYLNPNHQMYFMFIIPMKMWVLAVLVAVFGLYPAVANFMVSGSFYALLAPFLAYGNFILFFGFRYLKERRTGKKTVNHFKILKAVTLKRSTIHKCHICGKTEADDPNMDFRYCAQCEGDYEYCMDHLNNHEHIKKSAEWTA
jgi:hypothetical protein